MSELSTVKSQLVEGSISDVDIPVQTDMLQAWALHNQLIDTCICNPARHESLPKGICQMSLQ